MKSDMKMMIIISHGTSVEPSLQGYLTFKKTLLPISIENWYLKVGAKNKNKNCDFDQISHLIFIKSFSALARDGSFLEFQKVILVANHYLKSHSNRFFTLGSRYNFREHVSMGAVVKNIVCKLRAFSRRACKNSKWFARYKSLVRSWALS